MFALGFFQVVFPEMEESYVNSEDLECVFSLSDLVALSQGDRVALYKVPQISPHEFVSFQWVTEGTDKVVFKGKFACCLKQQQFKTKTDQTCSLCS